MNKTILINKIYKTIILAFVILLLINNCKSDQNEALINNDLIQAIKQNDIKQVNELSKDNKNINEQNEIGWTALHYASIYSKPKIIEILIEDGANIEIKNNEGNTPLIEALLNKNSENAIKLLEFGANPNNGNDIGGFPLLYIIEFNQNKWIELASIFLKYGAEINKKTYEGMTCLHYSISAGNYEYTKYLLENGSEVNAVTEGDSFLPSDFLPYITKNYTDIVESTEEDAQLRQKIEELLEDYGAVFMPIPNTIGRFGCLYVSVVNIINFIRRLNDEDNKDIIHINELTKPEYFVIKKNKIGGEDAIITIDGIKKMIEDNTDKKVKILWYAGVEAQIKLEEIKKSETKYFVIVNVGNHPVIKQHWVTISGYEEKIGGQKVLDRVETFIYLNPIQFKKENINALIAIEIL